MSTTTTTRIELRDNDSDPIPSACIYIDNGNLVIETLNGVGLRFVSSGSVHTDADGDVAVKSAGDVLHTTAGQHRIEATNLDLHARSILREDAGGVGHSYVAQTPENGRAEVHYWTPWHGTGNDPQPPEHPRIGTGYAEGPPIDSAADNSGTD